MIKRAAYYSLPYLQYQRIDKVVCIVCHERRSVLKHRESLGLVLLYNFDKPSASFRGIYFNINLRNELSKTSSLSFVEQNIDITIIVHSCSKGFSNGSSNMLRVRTCNLDLTVRRG